MSTATTSAQEDFATPARPNEPAATSAASPASPTQVTPEGESIRPSVTNSPDSNKQVRFIKKEESKRGLVSRRGRGHYAGRGIPSNDSVVEYPTFRSPTKDEVPSLCSASSSGNDTVPTEEERSPPAVQSSERAKASTPTHHNSHKNPSAMLVTTKKLAVDGAAVTSSASFDETHKKREQSVATPTDFAQDYGKPPASTGSFDTSNVLAWLQSPTANGLFSPGGYANIMGTPGGPKTPRTPTVSTSFFFSDVASLAKGEDSETPKNGKKKGIANIICISPLASSKARNGATPPVNMKEIFMSPEERRSRLRGMPLLSEDGNSKGRPRVPLRSASKDPSVEAVHLAERDLMEDEDMSVLLQLASNTPRSSAGGPVFRSPIPPPKGELKKGENMPALQLPMIGGKDVSNVRLERKSGDDAFIPPHLRMRDGTDAKKDRKDDKDGETSGKPHGRYPMHPHYPPHPDAPYGYPIPGVPMHHHGGPGGTMRVSIGGPPPPNKGTPPRPGMNSPRPPPPHYHEYPYPPPPHGMYPPQYPGPHPPMGYPPYPGHYPHGRHPPPPMPGYAAHPGAKKAGKGKKGAKRGLADAEEKGSKKRRSPGSSRKRRQVTPEVEGAARQKAAAVLGVNGSSGGKNDKAAALAAAILRGVTMRPSGKWQAQLYFAGKSRYIGVFDSREKAALAYEIAREKLKSGPSDASSQNTENLVNAARKAAFEGVNERIKD